MKIILCSSVKLGRLLKIILSTRAKKDSINSFFSKKIHFELLTLGNLNLFIQEKKYIGIILGTSQTFELFNKNENFFHNLGSSNILVLIFKKSLKFQKLQKTWLSPKKRKTWKVTNMAIEKSLTYIIDRKNKINSLD